MKTIKVLFFATAACFLATACTTSAPEDNCKEASYDNIMCYEYSRDDCGNIICAPPSSTDSKKFSSSSPVSSSSSTKKISSSSTVQSSSSVKISSSSFTEKSSSSKATSSSSQAKSSSSTKAISSSSVASSSSVEVKSIYEAVQESGKYTTRDSVAAYLCKFDKLPSNYVGKNEGQNLYESKTGMEFQPVDNHRRDDWRRQIQQLRLERKQLSCNFARRFLPRSRCRILRQEPRHQATRLSKRLYYLLYRRPLRNFQ